MTIILINKYVQKLFRLFCVLLILVLTEYSYANTDSLETIKKFSLNDIKTNKNSQVLTYSTESPSFTQTDIAELIIGTRKERNNSFTCGSGELTFKFNASNKYNQNYYTISIKSTINNLGLSKRYIKKANVYIKLNDKIIWSKRGYQYSSEEKNAENEFITFRINSSENQYLSFCTDSLIEWKILEYEIEENKLPNTIKGIGYSPFRDCQYPMGKPEPTIEDIENDLFFLYNTCNAIRTYSSRNINSVIPNIAKKMKLPIYMGAYIDNNPSADEIEMRNLLEVADTICPNGVIIGNEFCMTHKSAGDIKYLLNYILKAKEKLKSKGIKIGTAESTNDMFIFEGNNIKIKPEYFKIIKELDLIFVHIYPFWNGQSINGAAKFTVERYNAIKRLIARTFPKEQKEVIIGETGWPSGGYTRNMAVPNYENQRKYLYEFLMLAEKENVDFMFFDAFDELWKIREPNIVGPNWGYCYSDRTVKHPISSMLIPIEFIPSVKSSNNSNNSGIKKNVYKIYDDWQTYTEINGSGTSSMSDPQLSEFIPSGYMGDYKNIYLCGCERENPHSGEMSTVVSFKFGGVFNWGGVSWQSNEKWQGSGINIYKKLKCAKNAKINLTFWARGKYGGESIQIKIGGAGKDSESIQVACDLGWWILKKDWVKYSKDLSAYDLSSIIRGFSWITDKTHNPNCEKIEFYLDDIQYELIK